MSILRESSLFCLLALSTLAITACGGDDTPPPGDSKKPDDSKPVDPEPCKLRFDTEPLRWAAVGVGYEAAQQLQLSNDGEEACTVTISVEGDGFAIEAASVVVEEDAPQTVAVIWRPTAVGAATGTLSVAGDDGAEEIALTGEAVASCFSLSPEVVDFGETAPGCSIAEAEVLIENGCSHPVAIDTIRLNGGENGAPGTVFAVRGFPNLNKPIAAGESDPLDLVYKPQEVGSDSETLTVIEENGAAATAELRGTGRLETMRTDIFTQRRQVRADMLFVVDDSPAMAPYTARLQSLGEAVATPLIDWHTSHRFAMTTTSRTSTPGCAGSGADGRLVPFDGSGTRWLDTDSDLPAAAFGDLLDVETCSEAPNEGLAAAVRALTDPLVSQADDPAHPELEDGNLGYRRTDSGLWIVFVSASDDTSADSVGDIRSALVDAVGGPRQSHLLHVLSIIAPAGGCEAAEAGTRYAELAGGPGSVANLCDETTWRSLLDFGMQSWAITSRFFLTDLPRDADGNGDLAGELTVLVDGVEVLAIDTDDEVRWTYDTGANAIDFERNHIPPEGSEVAITYFVDCG